MKKRMLFHLIVAAAVVVAALTFQLLTRM